MARGGGESRFECEVWKGLFNSLKLSFFTLSFTKCHETRIDCEVKGPLSRRNQEACQSGKPRSGCGWGEVGGGEGAKVKSAEFISGYWRTPSGSRSPRTEDIRSVGRSVGRSGRFEFKRRISINRTPLPLAPSSLRSSKSFALLLQSCLFSNRLATSCPTRRRRARSNEMPSKSVAQNQNTVGHGRNRGLR